MGQRIRSRLFAAAIGVLTALGSVQAQQLPPVVTIPQDTPQNLPPISTPGNVQTPAARASQAPAVPAPAPAVQVPAVQAPAPQVPAVQAPAPQAPAPQVPAVQAPAPVTQAPPSVPAAMAGPTMPPATSAPVISGNGGCSSCAPAPGCKGVTRGGYLWSGPVNPTRLGSCPNGCGSVQQDFSFTFGSCKEWFSPCGGLMKGCNKNGTCGTCGGGKNGCSACGNGLFRRCPGTSYGSGNNPPFNPCYYDSYLTH